MGRAWSEAAKLQKGKVMGVEQQWRRICPWIEEELEKDLAEYRPFILILFLLLGFRCYIDILGTVEPSTLSLYCGILSGFEIGQHFSLPFIYYAHVVNL